MDAEHAARQVPSGQATAAPKSCDGDVELLRLVKIARGTAVKAHTQAMIALQATLVTVSDELRAELERLTDFKLITACAGFDETLELTGPDVAMRHVLGSLARAPLAGTPRGDQVHIRQLEQRTKTVAPQLVETFGIGIGFDSAAELLFAAGDNTGRIRSEAAFAKMCGVCPILASSGKTNTRSTLDEYPDACHRSGSLQSAREDPMGEFPPEQDDGGGSGPRPQSRDRPTLDRRAFLSRSGWAIGAALLGSRLTFVGHAIALEPTGTGLAVWGATSHLGRRAAIGFDGVTTGLFDLKVDAENRVTLGDKWDVSLPEGLFPHAVASTGAVLLLAGGEMFEVERMTVDNTHDSVAPGDLVDLPPGDPMPAEILEVPVVSARPVLYSVKGTELRRFSFEPVWDLPFGEAVAVYASGERSIVVAIEASADLEAAYADAIFVAEAPDPALKWTMQQVRDGLGEGSLSGLDVAEDRTVVSAVDQEREGDLLVQGPADGSGWRSVGVPPEVTPVASVQTGQGGIHLFGESEPGKVHQFSWVEGQGWQDSGHIELESDRLLRIVPINNAEEVILVGEHTSLLRAV